MTDIKTELFKDHASSGPEFRRIKIRPGLKIFFPLFFLFLVCSCDLLKSSSFEVESWTPGEGYREDPFSVKVSLLFSHECDKVRTEQAFSLTEDDRTLKGNFLWEGNRLVFAPASPIERDRDYAISLGTGAQDTRGLSLENKFEASFTTRHPGGKQKIIKTEPPHEGILAESRGEFRLFFSGPADLDSCRDNISFSPPAPGSWRLEDENKTVCFVPREPWQPGNLYRVKVDGNLSAASGHKLGTDYFTHFSAGADSEKPVLLRALAVNPDGEEEIPFEKSGVPFEAGYTVWENFTRLCLVFSEAVDLSEVKNLLLAELEGNLVMESPPEFNDRALFSIAGPVWGTSFLFRLQPGVKDRAGNESPDEYAFRITASGPCSRPPALAGIRLPLSPGNPDNPEPFSFSGGDVFTNLPIKGGEKQYPYNEEVPAWIELYFECALDTEIDPFSVMELFRVESPTGALDFLPQSVSQSDFTLDTPKEGWEQYRRLEVGGVLTNRIQQGIVRFCIPPGLKDKRGNRSAVDFRFSLRK